MGLDQYLYEMKQGMTPQEVSWNTQEKAYWRKQYGIRELFLKESKPVKGLEDYYIINRKVLIAILQLCLSISIGQIARDDFDEPLEIDKEDAIYSTEQLLRVLQDSDAETFLYVESY